MTSEHVKIEKADGIDLTGIVYIDAGYLYSLVKR